MLKKYQHQLVGVDIASSKNAAIILKKYVPRYIIRVFEYYICLFLIINCYILKY